MHTKFLILANKIFGLRKEFKSALKILIQSYSDLKGLEEIDFEKKSNLTNLKIWKRAQLNPENDAWEDPANPRVSLDYLFNLAQIRVEFFTLFANFTN